MLQNERLSAETHTMEELRVNPGKLTPPCCFWIVFLKSALCKGFKIEGSCFS